MRIIGLSIFILPILTACGGDDEVDLDDDPAGDDDDMGDDDDVVYECEPVSSSGLCGEESAIVRRSCPRAPASPPPRGRCSSP